MGTLVFQATLGGQVNLTGPNTASTFTISVPAVTGTMITSGDTGTVTNTMLASNVYTAPGTIGSGTPNTGAFTTLSASSTVTLSGGTANGVAYLNGSKVLTTGSALQFDGSNLGLGVTPSAWATYKAIEVGSLGCAFAAQSGTLDIGNNSYYSSGNKYARTGTAALYEMSSAGGHAWYNAPSGTAGNAITFTQAMTLDASGNLLVGTTTSGATGAGVQLWNYTGTVGTTYIKKTASGAYTAVDFRYAGTAVGSIVYTDTATAYNVTSDQRLKENIQDAADTDLLIDSLQVRKFDWKSNGSHQRYGFIAQELVTVAPEAVHQPADPDDMMAVDYSKLVPMLVKEIQSLRKRLAAAGI